MDESKVQEMLAMHDAGLTPTAIASELLVSSQTVRRILKEHDKEVSHKPKHIVDEDVVVQAYVDGRPVPEILAKNSITYTILYKILHDHKVETRKVSEKEITDVRLDRAVDLYKAGAPLWSIKQETGISQPTLHATLHRREILLRRPRML